MPTTTNIAIVATIGIIGGQALALVFLSTFLDASFDWGTAASDRGHLLLRELTREGGITIPKGGIIIRVVESAGLVTGVALVGFWLRYTGLNAALVAGCIGLVGASLFAALSIIEIPAYREIMPIVPVFLAILLFAIPALTGSIATVAAISVFTIRKSARSADKQLLDMKRRNSFLCIFAAWGLLAGEVANSYVANHSSSWLILQTLFRVTMLAFLLIGLGALGVWFKVLSRRMVGYAALAPSLMWFSLMMWWWIVADASAAALLLSAIFHVSWALGGALAAGALIAIVAQARRLRTFAQEQSGEPPNGRV